MQKGNAINSLVSNGGLILGAASAGFLVSGFGATAALAIDAASFFFSGAVIFTFRHLTPRAEVSENTMIDDLRHGWKVFISFRWIVIIVMAFSFIVMFKVAVACTVAGAIWIIPGVSWISTLRMSAKPRCGLAAMPFWKLLMIISVII